MRLTNCETIALNRLLLGGVGALSEPGRIVACRTINSLLTKQLIDKHGLTDKGRKVAETFNVGTPV